MANVVSLWSHCLTPRYLISQGADKEALTEEEKAVDLADPDDYKTISVLLNTQESVEKERRMSTVGVLKKEPAWFRRESMQRDSVLDPSLYRVKVGESDGVIVINDNIISHCSSGERRGSWGSDLAASKVIKTPSHRYELARALCGWEPTIKRS